MLDENFIVAIKNGKYIPINEFAPGVGEKCGCICPECGMPVRSNVTSKNTEQLKIDYTNHFSHIDEKSKCNGGFGETQIHLKAKEIIEANSSISVPGVSGKVNINYADVRVEPTFPNENYKRYRPDIIIRSSKGEDIAIEVVVTSPVTEIKRSLYRNNKFKSFIIDLSRFYGQEITKIENQFSLYVLSLTDTKNWIWPEVVVKHISGVKNERKPSIWEDPITWIISFAIWYSIRKALLNLFRLKPRHKKRRRTYRKP